MKLYNYLFKTILIAIPLVFISCDTDEEVDEIVVAPATYEFSRDGQSTVSFSGQTARLNMADEIYSALNTNTFTKAQLLEMFNDGKGFAGQGLDDSGKKVGSKTAAGCNHGALAVTKARYTDMLVDFADNVIPAWAGTAGPMRGCRAGTARSAVHHAVLHRPRPGAGLPAPADRCATAAGQSRRRWNPHGAAPCP